MSEGQPLIQPPPGPPLPSQAASPPPAPPFIIPPPAWPAFPARPSLLRRILMSIGGLLFLFSILLNGYLIVLLATGFDVGFAQTTIKEGKRDQTVAVYSMDGVIDGQVAERFSSFCIQVQGDQNVKAVLLRVDTPGGTVSAADQIHNLVARLQRAGKKVVVSMGGMATSGGYYVSASADEIVAEPTTITGSIGVIMTWPIIRGTLEKIGMESVVMKSTQAGAWKDEVSYLRQPDPRQRKHLQDMLDAIQSNFESVVRQGRGDRLKTRKAAFTATLGQGEEARQVELTETEPLNGKIYLPPEAKELGLVDSIGYLADALDRAANLARLDKPRVVRYHVRRSILTQLLENRSRSALDLGVRSLDEFQTPRILLMWKVE